MEEDQLTSTAEAARKRRDLRRRRILENSDNRMKRLMGQADTSSDLSPEGVVQDDTADGTNMWKESRPAGMVQQSPVDRNQGLRVPNAGGVAPVESSMLRPDMQQHYTQDYYSSTPIISRRTVPGTQGRNTTSPDLISPDLARPPVHTSYTAANQQTAYYDNNTATQFPLQQQANNSLYSLLGSTHQPATQQQLYAAAEVIAFNKKRSVICLVLGFLVRILLIFAFGRKFIQSMVYPFFALEIVFIGYQHAAGMDIGSGMQSGLWLTILTLCGIKKEFIDSYKLIMTIITTVGDDFTIYFFAFAIIHAMGKYFV